MSFPDSQRSEDDDDELEEVQEEDVVAISDEHLDETPEDDRIDFEAGMTYFPALTLVLIVANVFVFGWEIATDALEDRQAIINAGALEKQLVLQGDYWRLFSCMFLHGGIDHLVGNMVVLYILGMGCEHAFGPPRMLTLYFLSGLAGSLLSMSLEPGPSVGASGAIFGLLGVLFAVVTRFHKRLTSRDGRIAIVLVIWAIYAIATGFLDPWIANFAHLGGFLGGAALGAIIRPEMLDRRLADLKQPPEIG